MKLKPIYGACLLATALSANAQSSQTAENSQAVKNLSNLIVTAGFQPFDPDLFAGSTTVITTADIEALQATYLADLLRQVPGFHINQSGGPGTQSQLRVRGSEANHALVLVDGIRVNDPTANDEFLFNYGLLENIARIEIIRGPQSSIWGTDAVSAVINIITKQANQNTLDADLELGSFDTKRLAFNGGWQQDKWSVHAGFNALDSAGTNISRQGSEADGFENLTSHLKWNMAATEAVDLTVSLNHSNAMNEYDGTDFVVTGLPVDGNFWTERTQSSAQFAIDFSPVDSAWDSQFQYNWMQTDAENFTHDLGLSSATDSDSQEIKLNTSYQFNDRQILSLALDHRQIDFTQMGEASPFGDPNQNQDYNMTGVALAYRHQITEQFNWYASARLDDFNRFDDVSNFNLAANYYFNDDWRIRGSFATGNKAPSFIERFGFFPANFIGNPNLKPEESDAFELAVVKSWSQGSVELIYFNQDLSNEIDGFVFDPNSGLFTAANKAGNSDREGFELIWSGMLSDNLDYQFNYTYTDATEQDANGAQVQEVRRPKNQAHFNLNYRFADDKATLNGGVHHVGNQYDVFFDPVTFLSSNVKLDAYTTFDLTFSWRINEHWQTYVKGQNIFDEDYEEVLGYARPGAAYSVGIKTSF
ncbi:MAG: TonB-dependent receptor [Marinicella sp.]